jgi:AbiV family abortive infection protein
MFELLKKSSIKLNKPITKEQVATLLHFCWCNARDLYEEASILKENKKYARSFFLCVLALEELTKIPIATNALYLSKTDAQAWKGFWKTFNSHSAKQNAARIYGQGMLKKYNEERWSKFYKKQIPINLPLNQLKLASMYVDCYDGIALRPNQIYGTEKGSVSSIFEVVKDRLDGLGNLHSTIDKSIHFVKSTVALSVKINGLNAAQVIASEFRKRSKS